GELSHRLVKRFYARTNKRNYTTQIAAHERRQRLLRGINQRMNDAANAAKSSEEGEGQPDATDVSVAALPAPMPNPVTDTLQPQNEELPRTPPRQHHHISESKRTCLSVYGFPALMAGDPAVGDFLPKLRSHLLRRSLGLPYDGDETQFSSQDLLDVTFVRDHLYTHQVMRINYTTYDLHRDEDSINPRTHSDVMMLSHEDEDDSNSHPYWYARVIGIFHADVRHVGGRSNSSRTQRMESLWVRWFGRDLSHKAGWKAKRLPRLGFLDFTDSTAFGFLDPAEVIRGIHIIPSFHHGLETTLPKSIVRRPENQDDYVYYYVNL
ncbi:hypothetical protein B0H17DRAFT_943718, partial [Mycena rosella]